MTGPACPKINCSLYDVPELQPNPDISGIGVLIGFGISAYLTLIFCAAYFLLDREGNTNAVDRLVIDNLHATLGWRKKKAPDMLSEALQTAVLAFSDLQIVTGISLAVSGYSQLHCQLAIYDAQMIVDLVWFSSITHLATLTSLRRYFRKRPALRLWRMTCMTITAGMLSYAVIFTGFEAILSQESGSAYPNILGYPALCYLHPREMELAVEAYSRDGDSGYVQYNFPCIVLMMSFLVVSYVTRTIRLFPGASEKIQIGFRTKPSVVLKNKLACLKHKVDCANTTSSRRFRNLSYKGLLSVYCLFEATFDVYMSLAWEITWLAAALAWGTIRVLEDRWQVPSEVTEQENVWGFGQVVALCLLVLPLLAFSEIIYETITGGAAERLDYLSSRENPTYGPVQSYQDFYQNRWYRKLLLLIYLLSLAVAGDLVFTFAWLGLIENLQYPPLLSRLAIFYATWFLLNLAIVWSYTIICLTLGDLTPSLERPDALYFAVRRLGYTISKAQLRCLRSILWNGLIVLLVATSVAFVKWYKWYGGPGD